MATRKPGISQPYTKKLMSSSRSNSRRGGKTIKAAIDDFLLDRQSQNHSALPHQKSSPAVSRPI